jgi:glycosyltransferase involved in cell wall biosynthesis
VYGTLEKWKSHRLQAEWFPQFDLIAAVSQQDQEDSLPYLPRGNDRVCVVPNGVDLDYFSPLVTRGEAENKPTVLFTGSMDATMNQQAVTWFVEKVWPRIIDQIPEGKFYIVGRNPSSTIQQLESVRGVVVTGTVPDVRMYFSRADVCVIPIHLGGGSKLKTVEAMAMGLPIVSTQGGIQGIAVQSGVHLLLADHPEEFSDCVIKLLKDRSLADRLSQQARILVQKNYSWENIFQIIENRMLNLV